MTAQVLIVPNRDFDTWEPKRTPPEAQAETWLNYLHMRHMLAHGSEAADAWRAGIEVVMIQDIKVIAVTERGVFSSKHWLVDYLNARLVFEVNLTIVSEDGKRMKHFRPAMPRMRRATPEDGGTSTILRMPPRCLR
ncbi:hypothetical protein [Bauldia litoralis]|uniref:Uncharacterized protein n=1 Tax=Bauldia litoralis TaxID=665467 RepID=A0A1G6DUV9_9HYPH|nr:hypothetical protein [Bauldia litoralis]SDB48585.1 hypothetical protein SAMN02982931_03766 [Bauldia litoralis]